MEGYFYSIISSVPKRLAASLRHAIYTIERYFFLLYIDYFRHVPHGDIWDNAFGYAEETAKIIASLARRSNANVALIGQKGVGSLGIAKEVAKKIHSARAHALLVGKRVLFVHVDEVLGSVRPGMGQIHALENVVSQMERSGKNIAVLFGLDGVFAGNYAVSAEDVLYPFFSSPHMHTITILSDEEFVDHVAGNEKLAHYVEKVHIRGLDSAQTKDFLASRYKNVSPEVIQELVTRTKSIMPHVPYPKRAVDVLESFLNKNALEPHHIHQHVSKMLRIDLKRLKDAELVHIEEALGRHVVNQEHAKKEIHDACIRARSKASSARPLLSLLLSGPSGVGKRETALAMAQIYFGSKQRVVSVNMANITVRELPEIIHSQPACVLFLENFSQASPQVHDKMLSALVHGFITDTYGRKYFTRHMVIIASTTNETELPCSKELLERFDGVIQFDSLSQKHVQEIAKRKLSALNGRLQIEHDVSLDITDDLISYITEHGYSEQSGAHAMDGVIHQAVETKALEAIQQGKVVPGGKIRINPRQFT